MPARPTALPVPDPRHLGLGLIGLLSFASAGVSGLFVREHAALCSAGAAPHCGWCLAAAAFVIIGAASLAAAACAERPAR